MNAQLMDAETTTTGPALAVQLKEIVGPLWLATTNGEYGQAPEGRLASTAVQTLIDMVDAADGHICDLDERIDCPDDSAYQLLHDTWNLLYLARPALRWVAIDPKRGEGRSRLLVIEAFGTLMTSLLERIFEAELERPQTTE